MSTLSQHLTQIGKVKNLDKWVPHELTKTQNNHHFQVLSPLPLHNNNEPFLDRTVMCNENWMLYDNQQWPDQQLDWEEAPKHFLNPNLHPKKRSWSLVVCCPSDPLQLSESWLNHYIWQVCSASRWDILRTTTPAAGIDQQKGPNSSPWNTQPHVTQPTLQKLNELSYKVLPHPPHSPDLSPTDQHFFKHLDNFLQGKHFHRSRRQKMLSKNLSNPEAWIFMLQE